MQTREWDRRREALVTDVAEPPNRGLSSIPDAPMGSKHRECPAQVSGFGRHWGAIMQFSFEREFTYNRAYRGPIRLVVLDWAGTTMDFGCMAPAVVFC